MITVHYMNLYRWTTRDVVYAKFCMFSDRSTSQGSFASLLLYSINIYKRRGCKTTNLYGHMLIDCHCHFGI